MSAAHEITLARLSAEYNLASFDCGDEDLNGFLVEDALDYQRNYLANTTLMLCDGQLVTYFALVADSIRLSRNEREQDCIETPFATFPALKIARLATDVRFRGQGHGTTAVHFCIGLARHLNDEHRHDGIGCRFITVDAYPAAAPWYMEQFGFIKNETAGSNRETVSLRLDALPVED